MTGKEEKFFEVLREYTGYCEKAGALLDSVVSGETDPEEGYESLRLLKRQSRDVQGRLIERLYKAYREPAYANEARSMVVRMDGIINGAKDIVNTLIVYHKEETCPEGIHIMTKLIRCAVSEMVKIIGYTDDVEANLMKMDARCQRIYNMEERGDNTYRTTLQNLFYGDHDPMYAIRWREILGDLEKVLDSCAGMIPRFQRIMVKD